MGSAHKRKAAAKPARSDGADFDWEQFCKIAAGKPGKGVTCRELASRLGITQRHALTMLHRLIREGKIAYLRHEDRPTICGGIQKAPVYGAKR